MGKTYHITNDEHALLWRRCAHPPGVEGAASALAHLPTRRAGRRWRDGAGRAHHRKEPTLTRYSALILARTQTYNIAAAKRDLGYKPPISLEEGIEQTLSALRLEQLTARHGRHSHGV